MRDLADWDYNQPWYHGSPEFLDSLLTGSTITQEIALACVFSHKPQIVSIEDDVIPIRLQHNGRMPGFLYQVDEPVSSEDVYPHPRTSMPLYLEWLTRRILRVRLIGPVEIDPAQVLSEEAIQELLKRSSLQ